MVRKYRTLRLGLKWGEMVRSSGPYGLVRNSGPNDPWSASSGPYAFLQWGEVVRK